MNTILYYYKANITSVYDNNTFTADIDLGLGISIKGQKLRLSRINAPEIRGDTREAGLLSRDFLREKINGKKIIIQTIKDRKGRYGRYIAEAFVVDVTDSFVNINDILVENGFAVHVDYNS